jgi:nitroreductase
MLSGQEFSELIRSRRSIRDFLPTPIPDELLQRVLDDAKWAPSWTNTQPYYLVVASGALRESISADYLKKFDDSLPFQQRARFSKLKMLITGKGRPDGDFNTNRPYPDELKIYSRKTGFGLYGILGIERKDYAARAAAFRRNFDFFGAPTEIFIFVHEGLGEFAIQDAGIMAQTLMLSAHANGLGTCAQGAIPTWVSPVRNHVSVPPEYKLILGIAIGYPSEHKVNTFNPGRRDIDSAPKENK